MGIKANGLRYRSELGGEIIVGSEIRAALDELEQENEELNAQVEEMKELEIIQSKLMRNGEQRGVRKADEEIAELRAQLARCIEALEYLLSVNVGEADVEYGTACKNAEDAIRLAKE
jgi:predicted RNase H-like nuclease (RuvC/YqgF family)